MTSFVHGNRHQFRLGQDSRQRVKPMKNVDERKTFKPIRSNMLARMAATPPEQLRPSAKPCTVNPEKCTKQSNARL